MRQDFLDFFDAEYHLVVRFVMRTGASLTDAEDAAQHMALQGWSKITHPKWHRLPTRAHGPARWRSTTTVLSTATRRSSHSASRSTLPPRALGTPS